MKKFITTAIDYVNSLPHIGTAYEKLGADTLVRFLRMQGDDVLFQMGNDEHSFNVQKAAEAKGLGPKKYCDEMRPKFEDIWQKMNVRYDQFIQTSDPRHHAAVNKFFALVKKNNPDDIYQKEYEGWYCDSCEAFQTEKDLVDGLCPNHKTKPRWLKEKNYFFKLSRYAEKLLGHYEKNPAFILPEKRRNEVTSFVRQGLSDISISRSTFSWGIPVPGDEKHVFYVWFDALINYLTLIGFVDDEKKFVETWPTTTHIVGKDITRFHCVIWPAMLMSAGLPLPRGIFGHGFVYLRGEKMSKSLGNVVTPLDVLERYPDFGADALRYYLLRGSSFGDDGDFTWDGFIARYNADLANGIGNLVSRTLGMIARYQAGRVEPLNNPDAESVTILGDSQKVQQEVEALMNPLKNGDVSTHLALEKIWAYITSVDRYIDSRAPWTLAKNGEKEKLSGVLSVVTEAIRRIFVMCLPFVPGCVEKGWAAFGFGSVQNVASVLFADLKQEPFIRNSHQVIQEKVAIFPRLESKNEDAPKPATVSTPAPVLTSPESPLVDISDFQKLDLRVARVEKAERVPKADKLLKLELDVDGQKRQIIAGVAEYYTPEELAGKNIVIVANLKPAKIRGVESFGMMLAAKKDGKLFFVTPAGDIGSGAKVG